MKPFKGYDDVKAYSDYERLPKGGYILTILNAAERYWKSGGRYLEISCDIADGEYAGYFAKQYKNDTREDKRWKCNLNLSVAEEDGSQRDLNVKRWFKSNMNAIEESNPNYHWDWNEAGLKGLKVGGLFNIRQYKKSNGDIGEVINLAQFVDVNKILTNDYKLPKDKLLETETTTADFQSFTTVIDDALPFS